MLPENEVFSVITDGSSSDGHGWTSAFMEDFKGGYNTRGLLHKKLGYSESGSTFIKQIK